MEKVLSAEERGMQMMSIPMNKLPPLALEFAKKLCGEVGMCMETLLTAWTVYAQLVEGLECTDDLYKARPNDVDWFSARTTLNKPQKLVIRDSKKAFFRFIVKGLDKTRENLVKAGNLE